MKDPKENCWLRGTLYKRRPRRQRGVRTSAWNKSQVNSKGVAMPDGIEDFNWQSSPIKNDGTGTVANRSGGVRIVRIPYWDE